jgi:DNA-binding transcriptional LysR family regulator
MNVDNLADIAVFVKVVEAGSFTAAAEAMGSSQPVVSKSITRLEERLGARLLNRTTRRLSLTEAGAELYRRSSHALAAIGEAELEVASLQTEPRGTLKVNAPTSFAVLHLAASMKEFLDRFPGVSIDLSLDDGQVDVVEEGYDVVIRIGRLQDSTLVARKLAPCRLALCASPAYLEKHGEPREPEDLLNHNCLQYTLGTTPRSWRLRRPDGSELMMPIKGNWACNNGEAEREACIAGLGISYLPTFYVADALRAGLLKRVLRGWELQDFSVHAVYPERRNLTPKVRAFVDFLAARYAPEPYWDAGVE